MVEGNLAEDRLGTLFSVSVSLVTVSEQSHMFKKKKLTNVF